MDNQQTTRCSPRGASTIMLISSIVSAWHECKTDACGLLFSTDDAVVQYSIHRGRSAGLVPNDGGSRDLQADIRAAVDPRHGTRTSCPEMHALLFRNFMKRFFFAFPKCHCSVARRSRISAVRATLPRRRRYKNSSATDPTPRRHTTTLPPSPLRPFFGVLSHSPALPPPPPPTNPPPTQVRPQAQPRRHLQPAHPRYDRPPRTC